MTARKVAVGIISLVCVTGADGRATLTKVNVAANDIGGGIEEISGFFGPGFTGRRLIDGRSTPAWRLDWFSEVAAERRTVDGPNEKPARLSGPTYPLDIVFSFFDRQPALVGAVTIVLPTTSARLPKDVEVWTSMDSAAESFVKAAERSLTALPAEQTLAFSAREARYVKLRVLSGASESDLEIAEVRVLEAARNLKIVPDVTGSINAAPGKSTRWQTALDVLKNFVGTIPEDFKVALRVYGHRHPSKSAETCTDTELIVPLAKLDRDRIMTTASTLRPRRETPLVLSVLKTIGDLKVAGGGTVILITDGEESCKGDSKAAAAAIEASGLNVTLNIVGFTLTGQAVKAQLTTLAGSTGGNYFGAASADQLSQAVRLAALPRMPFEILDASGCMLASGQTGEPARELAAGDYLVRIKAPGQPIEQKVTIAPDHITTLSFAFEGEKLVITAQGATR